MYRIFNIALDSHIPVSESSQTGDSIYTKILTFSLSEYNQSANNWELNSLLMIEINYASVWIGLTTYTWLKNDICNCLIITLDKRDLIFLSYPYTPL